MSEPHEPATTADIARASSGTTDDADAPVGHERGDEADAPAATGARDEDALTPLFAPDERDELGRRWQDLQTGFVDDPRTTVEEADRLVADLMQRLAESFAREREALESQWSRGDDVSTEDLRIALRRYRSFFERLLSA